MNSKKLILTDIDGVVLDWEIHFHTWVRRHGYDKVDTSFYRVSEKLGMVEEEAVRLITEFNGSSYIMNVPSFKDARTGIATLVDNGYRFRAITSLGDDPGARILRQINLENIFGKEAFESIICLPLDSPKDDELSNYKDSGQWWIEDKAVNAVVGADNGLNSLLMAHPHNQYFTHPKVSRVNDWAHIVSVILNH